MSKAEEHDFDETALYGAVANRIRNARLKHNLTQQDLADRIQAKRSYIFELESGSANPTLRTLYRLGKALGIPPSELLPDSNRPQLTHAHVKELTTRCDAILSALTRHNDEERDAIGAFRSVLEGLTPAVDVDANIG